MATQISRPANAARDGAPKRFYPLELPFTFQVLKRGQVIERGYGDTSEISSTHIRVKPLEALCLAHTEVVMSIGWPAKLKDGTCLQLVVLAKLSRYAVGVAEFAILKYEFRTVSKATQGLGLLANFGAGATCGVLRDLRQEASLYLRPQLIGAACGA